MLWLEPPAHASHYPHPGRLAGGFVRAPSTSWTRMWACRAFWKLCDGTSRPVREHRLYLVARGLSEPRDRARFAHALPRQVW